MHTNTLYNLLIDYAYTSLFTNLSCIEPKEIHKLIIMNRGILNETLVRWSMNECQNIFNTTRKETLNANSVGTY